MAFQFQIMDDDSTFLLQLKLYALNSDLIIIQKANNYAHALTHAHTHTHGTAVLFARSAAARGRLAVVVQLQQAAAVAESWLQWRRAVSSCGGGSWVAALSWHVQLNPQQCLQQRHRQQNATAIFL